MWYGRAALLGRNHRLIRRVLAARARDSCSSLGLSGHRARRRRRASARSRRRAPSWPPRSQAAVVELYALESRLAAGPRRPRAARRAGGGARAPAGLRPARATAPPERTMATRSSGSASSFGSSTSRMSRTRSPSSSARRRSTRRSTGSRTSSEPPAPTETVLDQARAARRLIATDTARARGPGRPHRAPRDRLAATAADLEQARSERTSYLAQLRQEQALTTPQIADLEAQAQRGRSSAPSRSPRRPAAAGRRASPRPTSAAQRAATPTAPGDDDVDTSDRRPGEPPPAPVESVSQAGHRPSRLRTRPAASRAAR